MNQIYTAGYRGHSPQQLMDFAAQRGAVVADIRYAPISRQCGWNRSELASLFGRSYFHLAALGNVNYNSAGGVCLANASRGLAILKDHAARQPVIVLCGCEGFDSCHRAEVSRLLAKDGILTQEIVWPEEESQSGRIKCISLWQPWASLMFLSEEWRKRIETRSWQTSYRGPLVIHAAKTLKGMELIEPAIARALTQAKLCDYDFDAYELRWHTLPLGTLLGVVNLTGCQPTETLENTITRRERAFGNYEPGRFGWITEDARALPSPVPYRGTQRIFEIDAGLLGDLATP